MYSIWCKDAVSSLSFTWTFFFGDEHHTLRLISSFYWSSPKQIETWITRKRCRESWNTYCFSDPLHFWVSILTLSVGLRIETPGRNCERKCFRNLQRRSVLKGISGQNHLEVGDKCHDNSTHVYIYICVYIHVCIYTHIYIYMYICK